MPPQPVLSGCTFDSRFTAKTGGDRATTRNVSLLMPFSAPIGHIKADQARFLILSAAAC